MGELGRLPYGDPVDRPETGLSEKRNNLAESCQNDRRDTNISSHPAAALSLKLHPTVESSEVIKPIRSNFWSKFRPRKMPSLFMLIRQSPLGLPASGVLFEASVVR